MIIFNLLDDDKKSSKVCWVSVAQSYVNGSNVERPNGIVHFKQLLLNWNHFFRATPFRALSQWLTVLSVKFCFTFRATHTSRPESHLSVILWAAFSYDRRSRDQKCHTWYRDSTPTYPYRVRIWARSTTTLVLSTWVIFYKVYKRPVKWVFYFIGHFILSPISN